MGHSLHSRRPRSCDTFGCERSASHHLERGRANQSLHRHPRGLQKFGESPSTPSPRFFSNSSCDRCSRSFHTSRTPFLPPSAPRGGLTSTDTEEGGFSWAPDVPSSRFCKRLCGWTLGHCCLLLGETQVLQKIWPTGSSAMLGSIRPWLGTWRKTAGLEFHYRCCFGSFSSLRASISPFVPGQCKACLPCGILVRNE